MTDGILKFDTKLDSSGFQKGMQALGSIANGMCSTAKVGIMAIGSGVTAAATATTTLVKSAVSGYAEFEQLTGGVETLFKDSSDTVLQYSKNAYQTAGMSANQYMETVTSFSASLLQSLDGDTAAAADKANVAITDMSDNANKMGTSMELIQNAYNGFAKQNYTMLDNLKLGYGGTKEEMQRLLEDAEKISGVKYDLSSYADIVDAIHVVQTEMGISGITAEEAAEAVANGTMTEEEAFAALGTTAKEASTTIEGSLNMTKAAWDNLVTGLGDKDADLDALVQNLVDSAATAAENLLPVIETVLAGIGDLISELVPVVLEAVPTLVTDVLPNLFEAGKNLLYAVLQGLQQNLPSILSGASAIVTTLVNAIVQMAPMLFQMGADIITQLLQGISNNLPQMASKAVDVINGFAGEIDNNGAQVLAKGVEIVGNILKGIAQKLPDLLAAAVKLVVSIEKSIIKNLPLILKTAVEIVMTLIKGLVSKIPEIKMSCVELIGEMINAFANTDWISIGKNIVDGIAQGIKNFAGNLVNAAKEKAGNLYEGVKNEWGIHSPSKKFRWLGEMCVKGMEEPLQEYNPYQTLNNTMKYQEGTFSMNYKANGFDYELFGKSTVAAFTDAGVTVSVDGRPFGRLVRRFV